MKILITGGCGFVGSNIAIYLKKKIKNAKIFTLDNLTRGGSILNNKRLRKHNIKNFKFDIEKYETIKLLPKFDLIIDCCAEAAIEVSRREPVRVFYTNLVGTFNILNKCVNDGAHIIFLSSSRVYSIQSLRKLVNNLNLKGSIKTKRKINETFVTENASSLYGFTKLASEKLIKEFFYKKKLKYLINRFGVIAGPWQFGKQDQGFVSLWMARHFYKKKLSYIGFGGNGHQIRDIIHIDDVCKIIFIQIKKLKTIYNDTFNIGGGPRNAVSLKNLTIKCQNITKNKIKITRKNKTSDYDIPYYVTDNAKIYKFYKWRPIHSIDSILNDIYNWLKKNLMLKKYFK